LYTNSDTLQLGYCHSFMGVWVLFIAINWAKTL